MHSLVSIKHCPQATARQSSHHLIIPCFRCYNANNGLSYCWCSTKDLCNGATAVRTSRGVTVVAAVVAIVSAWWGAT